MRLMFLCLVAGEAGFALFAYYGYIAYHDLSRAWVGGFYALLPLVAAYGMPGWEEGWRAAAAGALATANLTCQDRLQGGSGTALAVCSAGRYLYIITGLEEGCQARIMEVAADSLKGVILRDVLAGWQICLVDGQEYVVPHSALVKTGISWEKFWQQLRDPSGVTYDRNHAYWLTLGVASTVAIFSALLFLLALT